LPAWVLLIVFAREIAMTVFRQMAQRRGVVIGASRIAKWKTGFQFVWMGTAYAWFTFATLGERMGWIANADAPLWHSLALFTTSVGAIAMIASVVLALWSLWEYVMKYGHVFTAARPAVRRP
jgi:phosphatidylglycerophosphate synthase